MPLNDFPFETRAFAGLSRISVGDFPEFADVEDRRALSTLLATVLASHGAWSGTPLSLPVASIWRRQLRERGPEPRVVAAARARRGLLRRPDELLLVELPAESTLCERLEEIWETERPVLLLGGPLTSAAEEAYRLQAEETPTAAFARSVALLVVAFYHRQFLDFYTARPDSTLEAIRQSGRDLGVAVREVQDGF